MLSLKPENREEGLRLLFIGAHCDDIEIGCGGTILRLSSEYKIKEIKWIVFTSTLERSIETKKSAENFLHTINSREVVINEFKDGFLSVSGVEVKNYFEELKNSKPDMIFTHYRQDLHQDHRFLSELTWNTFRDHLILEYEIPKYDGDLGHPNFFVPLESAVVEKKIETIIECYPSQRKKQWFDKETFQALMRIRGLECAADTKYAEAFYIRKSTL